MREQTGSRLVDRPDELSHVPGGIQEICGSAGSKFGEIGSSAHPAVLLRFVAKREEVTVELEPGKTLIIRLLTVGEARTDGMRTVFFELNGQPREVEIQRPVHQGRRPQPKRKADPA